MNKFLKLIAGAALFAVSAGASAQTFDFRDPGGLGAGVRQGDDSLLFTIGALEVEVRGYTLAGFDTLLPFQTASDQSEFVDQNGNGIIFDRPGDSHEVDGAGANEVITFTFNTNVRVEAVNFDFGDGNFRAFNDLNFAGPGFTGTEVFSGPVDGNAPFQITNFNPVLGPSDTFALGAFGSNDSFKIRTLTVAIPEPATWLMMIIGFALVGLARKRRQQNVLA
jgi:hypothetical protein